MISFTSIAVFYLLSFYCEGAYVVPKNIHTQIGGSYVVYVQEDNVKPEECYVSDTNNKYKINLLTSGVTPEVVHKMLPSVKSEKTDTMTSLGNGICGFKVDNISEKTTENWELSLIDKKGQNYTVRTCVVIKEGNQGTEKRTAAVGESITIFCANDIKELNYCHVYNPAGELVMIGGQSCSYSITLSRVSDFGIWKCYLSYTSSMTVNEINYEIIQMEKDQIHTWQNETNTHVNLGCYTINPTNPLNFCLMVRPDGKLLTLQPGLATDRYTALYTNITKQICGMEIKKPLIDQDKGAWRCEQYFAKEKPIGGFISLSGTRKIESNPEIPTSIFVHVNNSLNIKCRVPHSSKYCYMRGPDGLIYPVEDSRSVTLGMCDFTKPNAKLTDNGTWFCGFARETGTEDEVYEFQVYIPEVTTIRAEKQSVEVKLGNTIQLMCTTSGLGDYPLQYCRFLSPSGRTYHIGNHAISERISYSGRGLEYGECGIKIHDVQESDKGTWSCITRIGRNFVEKEVYTNIHLTTIQSDVTLAAVTGICVGVAIVVVGIAFLAFRRLKTGRFFGGNNTATFQRNANVRNSNSSNSSSDSTVAFNITSEPAATYNSTTN